MRFSVHIGGGAAQSLTRNRMTDFSYSLYDAPARAFGA